MFPATAVSDTGCPVGLLWPEAQLSLNPWTLEALEPRQLWVYQAGAQTQPLPSGAPQATLPFGCGLEAGTPFAGWPGQLWFRPVELHRNHLILKCPCWGHSRVFWL